MTRPALLVISLSALPGCDASPSPPASSVRTGNTKSTFVIFPYKLGDTWVFDDPSRGLDREPFVGQAARILDRLTANISDATSGFRLTFSSSELTGDAHRLSWRRSGVKGDWYHSEEFGTEGWLCPALLEYFSAPPRELFIRVGAR